MKKQILVTVSYIVLHFPYNHAFRLKLFKKSQPKCRKIFASQSHNAMIQSGSAARW